MPPVLFNYKGHCFASQHHSYTGNSNGGFEADIGLIQTTPFAFTSRVQPISLPDPGADYVGSTCTLSGWGRTECENFKHLGVYPANKAPHLMVTLLQCCHLVFTKWQYSTNVAIMCPVCWLCTMDYHLILLRIITVLNWPLKL